MDCSQNNDVHIQYNSVCASSKRSTIVNNTENPAQLPNPFLKLHKHINTDTE